MPAGKIDASLDIKKMLKEKRSRLERNHELNLCTGVQVFLDLKIE